MVKALWNEVAYFPSRAAFRNGVDYAADVHEGKDRWDGTRMPARPWMDAAVSETDIVGVFVRSFKATADFGQAFVDAAEALHDQMRDNIMDDRWGWDRTTYRSNGNVVDQPRNIIDSGALLRAQHPPEFSGVLVLW